MSKIVTITEVNLWVNKDNFEYAIDQVKNGQGSKSWHLPVDLWRFDGDFALINGHHRIAESVLGLIELSEVMGSPLSRHFESSDDWTLNGWVKLSHLAYKMPIPIIVPIREGHYEKRLSHQITQTA